MTDTKQPRETPAAGTQGAPPGALIDMPIADLTRAVSEATAALATIEAALPGRSRLSPEDRRETGGQLRKGESKVLQIVADTASQPAYASLFASLSDLDFGLDPDAFEPALLKDRLQKIDALLPLADRLGRLSQGIRDTVLELQQLARDPLLDAYSVLRNAAKTDPALRAQIADVIRFYAAAAQAAKAKKAAESP